MDEALFRTAFGDPFPDHPFWGFPMAISLADQVDPFRDTHLFRPLHRAYTGDDTFWRTPSPEPGLDDGFWASVMGKLGGEAVGEAARLLAARIRAWEPDGRKLLFVAILRAGVPVADWLCRMIPGSRAVAISLFVGLGIDQVSLDRILARWPERRVVFVDGWTGKGGVSRTVRALGKGPLAVLVDPWEWADFSGSRADLFCPSACFTGLATLGFSRTFYVGSRKPFAAYRFGRRHLRPDVIAAWQNVCPDPPEGAAPGHPAPARFTCDIPWRIHSNEVCRALINADPRTLYFRDDPAAAEAAYPLLLTLARRRGVDLAFRVRTLADARTRVACELNTRR